MCRNVSRRLGNCHNDQDVMLCITKAMVMTWLHATNCHTAVCSLRETSTWQYTSVFENQSLVPDPTQFYSHLIINVLCPFQTYWLLASDHQWFLEYGRKWQLLLERDYWAFWQLERHLRALVGVLERSISPQWSQSKSFLSANGVCTSCTLSQIRLTMMTSILVMEYC